MSTPRSLPRNKRCQVNSLHNLLLLVLHHSHLLTFHHSHQPNIHPVVDEDSEKENATTVVKIIIGIASALVAHSHP